MAQFARTSVPALLSLLSLVAVSGCHIIYGDDDDDCLFGGDDYGTNDGAYEPNNLLRNPDSGTCEYVGGTVPPCNDPCSPCPETDVASPGANEADRAPTPTWGICDGYCETLDEATCYATAGCRAAFAGDQFYQCWATDQSGPIQGGGCAGLGAWDCSLHDDCVAVHGVPACAAEAAGIADEACPEIGWFESCRDEPIGCAGDESCPDGMRCNASDICLSPPGCEDNAAGCDAACYGYCVPDDGIDPGRCYDEVLCDSLPPNCPEGTRAGVIDGCWSGYCIPLDRCERVPPMEQCEAIVNEADCIARPDCTPLYTGIDCSCDETGCSCADWEFASCAS